MEKEALLAKTSYSLSALATPFLFFAFLGKAYGDAPSSPCWFDLLFGGEKAEEALPGLRCLASYSPTPLAIALFSFLLLSSALGLWLFSSVLLRQLDSLVNKGLSLLHAFSLFVCFLLVCLSLPVYGVPGPLGSGSICLLVFFPLLISFDLAGILLSRKGRR